MQSGAGFYTINFIDISLGSLEQNANHSASLGPAAFVADAIQQRAGVFVKSDIGGAQIE
jgi:hypothetical protein